MSKAVFGVVSTRADGEELITSLRTAGFSQDDISVLFPDEGPKRDFAHAHGTRAPEGAVVGSSVGGVAGGVLGLLAGLGVIAVPGLGALVAAGPILSLLSGAAVGGAAGSAVGALVGVGIPEIHAKVYEAKLRGGNVLVAVHTKDAAEIEAAKRIFETMGAEDIHTTNEASVPSSRKKTPMSRGAAR